MKSKFIMRSRVSTTETGPEGPPPLSEIAINTIAAHFETLGSLKSVPEYQKEKIYARIDLSTANFEALSRTVDSEGVWARACAAIFNVSETGLSGECRLGPVRKTFKQKFLELYLQRKLKEPGATLESLQSLAEAFGSQVLELRVDKVAAGLSPDILGIFTYLPGLRNLCLTAAASPDSEGQVAWRGIDLPGARRFAGALRAPGLEELSLSGNGLDAEAFKVILKALAKAPALRRLCLAHNSIGDEGVRKLCKFIVKRGQSLRQVDVSDCELGYESARIFAELLARPESKIEELRMSMNFINANAAEKIFELLASNPKSKLQTLDLSSNMINRDVSGPLSLLLRTPSELQNLYLDGNELSMTESAVRKVANAIALNSKLKVFSLLCTNIPKAQVALLTPQSQTPTQ